MGTEVSGKLLVGFLAVLVVAWTEGAAAAGGYMTWSAAGAWRDPHPILGYRSPATTGWRGNRPGKPSAEGLLRLDPPHHGLYRGFELSPRHQTLLQKAYSWADSDFGYLRNLPDPYWYRTTGGYLGGCSETPGFGGDKDVRFYSWDPRGLEESGGGGPGNWVDTGSRAILTLMPPNLIGSVGACR